MGDAVSRRYELVCKLAGGGMADLYLGRTLGPGGFERLVVIKRLAQRLASQPSAVQALFDEARIAATLSHANIVQVTDIEIADGQVSIVMEYLHGHDASHLLRRMKKLREPVPLDQAIAIVLGVCAGLHHAHERVDSQGASLDIVHRDVSPHNVFITYDGAVKLVDFGIARASVRRGHTDHGFIKGKPGYIAPEQIRGRKTDRRTDVWGAAVLLYELTTGVTPYGPGKGHEDLAKVTKHDAPRPSTVAAAYPADLEAIVMRGLARDPAQRYATADALRVAIEDFARARNLDLSPFRLAALMERVFAENLEAWRQSQRMGRSLAEHVAAFKTSGAHEMIDLPGDPTEPDVDFNITNRVTKERVSVEAITAPTQLIDPPVQVPLVHVPLVQPVVAAAPLTAEDPTAEISRISVIAELAPPPRVIATPPPRLVVTRPRWKLPFAVGLATPTVLLVSLLAWGAVDSNQTTAATTQSSVTDDKPVAQPITIAPLAHDTSPEQEPAPTPEPEPVEIAESELEPIEPAESEPSIEIELDAPVARAPAPARKRPAAKAAKRRAVRSAQPPRPVAAPAPRPPPPAEDDLDALLPH